MMRTIWMIVVTLMASAGCETSPPQEPSIRQNAETSSATTNDGQPREAAPEQSPTDSGVPKTGDDVAMQPATANAKLRTQPAGTSDPFSDAPLAGKPPEAFVFPQPPLVMPPVLLTSAEAQTCPVVAGDQFPDLSLAKLAGGSPEHPFQPPLGAPTVVLFWTPDNPYAQQAQYDVNDLLGGREDDLKVQVVGVCVANTADAAKTMLAGQPVDFVNYFDAKGAGYAKVALAPPPRIYLLDEAGKILWFDLEFSRGTRRELIQAIRFLVSQRKAG